MAVIGLLRPGDAVILWGKTLTQGPMLHFRRTLLSPPHPPPPTFSAFLATITHFCSPGARASANRAQLDEGRQATSQPFEVPPMEPS